MNHSEIRQVQRKLNACQATIKQQHQLPPAKRDNKKINEALNRSKILLRKLKD